MSMLNRQASNEAGSNAERLTDTAHSLADMLINAAVSSTGHPYVPGTARHALEFTGARIYERINSLDLMLRTGIREIDEIGTGLLRK